MPADERGGGMTKLRTSVGGAYMSRGKAFARVTVAPQKRLSVLLPWCADLATAKARGVLLQGLVMRLREAEQFDLIEKVIEVGATDDAEKLAAIERAVDGVVAGFLKTKTQPKVAGVETFGSFRERWTSGELARRFPDHVLTKRSAQQDEWRSAKYIEPILEDKPLTAITLEDLERVMAALPAGLKPATRWQVAQLFRRVMKLAVYPAKLIAHNPVPPGALPKKKTTLATQFLYPEEDAQLLGCTAVDLGWRVLYGFLLRTGWRLGEAIGDWDGGTQGLTWSMVDLSRGITRIDRNKTDDPRPIALDPATTAALAAWKKLSPKSDPSDCVFVLSDGTAIGRGRTAEYFRDHLAKAGVDRTELYERSAVRRPIRLHDTRASFVTISLANGRSETYVRDRTGHKSQVMVDRYRRLARTFEELNIGDFTPLDRAIPELAATLVAANAAADSEKLLSARRGKRSNSAFVAPTGLEPVRPCGPKILNTNDAGGPSGNVAESFATEKNIFGRSESSSDAPPDFAAASVSPRAKLIADLAERVRELALTGDLHAARVAQEALAKLLAEPVGDDAEVIDLGTERAKRS